MREPEGPDPTAVPATEKKRSYLLLFLLISAAFAGNFFAYRVFTGFSYLFGSIAAIMVLYLYGVRWGVFAAFVASSWTMHLFGHPYAMIWLCGEPLFIGWLLEKGGKRNIILYDAIYWPFIGIPLLWIFFRLVMHAPLLGTVAASLMYWLIGMTNAVLASLALTYLPQIANIGREGHAPPIPVHRLLFNLLLAIALIPAMILMVLRGKNSEEEMLARLYEELHNSARMALYRVLPVALPDSGQKRLPGVALEQPDNTLVKKRDDSLSNKLSESRIRPFHTLFIVDAGNRIIADSGNAGKTVIFEECRDGEKIVAEPKFNISACTPSVSFRLPAWKKASEITYATVIPLSEPSGLKLVSRTPFAPYQEMLFEDHIQSMLMVLSLNMLAMLASMYASGSISAPLRKLSKMTTDLPEQLLDGKIPEWSQSRIEEINRLTLNFRNMAVALNSRFQEITIARNTLERRVEERTRELSEINSELQKEIQERRMTERQRDRLMTELRLKNRELEGILYITSHDLRSPLVNVQGFSRKLLKSCAELEKLLKEDGQSPLDIGILAPIIRENIPRSLGFITGSIEKMDNMLSALLRLSRIGNAALDFGMIDMEKTINGIISSMSYQLEQIEATVEIGDIHPCFADAGQVAHIFGNLLDNAIKFRSPERPLHISIQSEEIDDNIRYSVEDNGVGVAEEQQERIWEIFHRLDPNAAPGEGLGLTISRLITERLGGSIWIESEPGRGSRFCVMLPGGERC